MKAENDVDLADLIVAELAPVIRAHLRERLPALLRAAKPRGPRRVYAPVSEEDRAAAEKVDDVTRALARKLLEGRR